MIRRSSAIATLGALIWCASFSTPAFAVGEPGIVRAATVDDGDGHLDAVSLTFSAPMNTVSPPASWFATTAADPGFFVDGYPILSGAWTNNNTLKLNVTPLATFDTGATPIVRYRQVAGGPSASTTGLALASTGTSGIVAADAAGPVIVAGVARDAGAANLFRTVGDELRIAFSEPVSVAGVGAARLANLENAIKFTNVPADGAPGCTQDGTALSNQNFPQASTGTDPITVDNGVIVAKMNANNLGSNQWFVGVPKGCVLAIETSNNSAITDAAGNTARPYNAAPGKTIVARITPAPITLANVKTADGAGSTPDGVADGLSLTFTGPLNDDTISRLGEQLTISVAGVDVPAGDVDTAGIVDDATARVAVDLPGDVTADAVEVSYTAASCAHAPSGTTTDGVAGKLPYGSPFFACVGSFAASATDGVGPAVLQAVTADADTDGIIDSAVVTFSEDVAASAPAGWKLGEAAATAFTPGADARHATITFPEGTVADGGDLPELSYVHQSDSPTLDGAQNEVPTASWPTSDGVGPGIASAVATDTDDDGNIDRITAELSEDAKVPNSADPAVTFGTHTAERVTVADDSLVATFDGPTGSGTADVVVTGGITDLGGTPMTATPFTGTTETIAPRAVIDVSPSAPIKAGAATVIVDYSEKMADEALTVTLGSATVAPVADESHTANGWRIDDPSIWEGAITIASDACAVSTGCPVTLTADGGHDLTGLAPDAAQTLETAIDTMAPDAGPITAISGVGSTGAPANVVNNQARNLSAAVDIADGQADGGSVEIKLDGNALTPPMRASIPAGATTINAISDFDDAQALRTALGEQGEHQLTAEICDAATNCVTSEPFSFLVDTVVAEPSFGSLGSNLLVRGGANVPIRWETDDAAEPVTVDVAWSKDGTRWTTLRTGQPASGSYTWKTPLLEATNLRIRVTSKDANGNLAPVLAPGRLTVDSLAPVVKRFTVPTGVLPAGRKVTLRWLAQDASLHLARAPIVLQESLDGGRTWRSINGGSYAKTNDGAEVLKIPAGASSSYRLRLVATDAVRRTTTFITKTLTKR